MFKLEKIYIENFKGIKTSKIIDFDANDLSILNGPNGFGKTTVFDAIELCLRGKLERTIRFYNIQKNNQDYRKPFYQNTSGADVIIKVLFKDTETAQSHIFAKFLDRNSRGKIGNGRAFKPDAWAILETLYSDDPAIFASEWNKEEYTIFSQEQIDRLFYPDSNLSLQNLYPLFNYIQQEENIYFLKKDEEEKKNELDFLFQTQQHASDLDRLTSLSRETKAIHEELRIKIERLGQAVGSESRQVYLRLFEDKELAYDKEEPFLEQTPASLPDVYEVYKTDMEMLQQFITSFSAEEYKKDKVREAIVYATQNRNLLTAFAFQQLYEETTFRSIEQLSIKRASYNLLKRNLEHDRFDPLVIGELGFSDEFITQYSAAIQNRSNQQGAIGVIGRIIAELIDAREITVEKSSQLSENIQRKENCPLCDTKFDNYDILKELINRKTESLMGFNRSQILRLEETSANIISTFRKPILQTIEIFLSKTENQLDDGFYSRLLEYRGFVERIERFKFIISESDISYADYVLQTPVSNSILDETIDKLIVAMNGTLANVIPDQSKLLYKQLYKDLFKENAQSLISLSEVENKIKYVEYKFNEARVFSLNKLIERHQKLTELESQLNHIKETLSRSIKDYKLAMIEKVKVPFYLYSGKILQNYQQGLGIFIDMQQNTNRVRFLTDSESDHDIIHHLSSGQLAVVSIAFCLALNKVYETNNHFKFLAIDDPVQTLDDINIHSFIELMRHEFSGFQILMSTHEDDIASYLNYKFDSFNFRSNRINVQTTFYGN